MNSLEQEGDTRLLLVVVVQVNFSLLCKKNEQGFLGGGGVVANAINPTGTNGMEWSLLGGREPGRESNGIETFLLSFAQNQIK